MPGGLDRCTSGLDGRTDLQLYPISLYKYNKLSPGDREKVHGACNNLILKKKDIIGRVWNSKKLRKPDQELPSTTETRAHFSNEQFRILDGQRFDYWRKKHEVLEDGWGMCRECKVCGELFMKGDGDTPLSLPNGAFGMHKNGDRTRVY
jgi:hypothetical protein